MVLTSALTVTQSAKLVKQRRALLGSNPPRNSQPKLIKSKREDAMKNLVLHKISVLILRIDLIDFRCLRKPILVLAGIRFTNKPQAAFFFLFFFWTAFHSAC